MLQASLDELVDQINLKLSQQYDDLIKELDERASLRDLQELELLKEIRALQLTREKIIDSKKVPKYSRLCYFLFAVIFCITITYFKLKY